MRVEWAGTWPPETRGAVEPHVLRWAPLVSSHLAHLRLWSVAGDGPADTLAIRVQPEYRLADLHVHPAFLDGDAEERSRGILHELLHVPVRHVVVAFIDLQEAAAPDDTALGSWASEVRRRAEESCVVDLEQGILRLLEERTCGS